MSLFYIESWIDRNTLKFHIPFCSFPFLLSENAKLFSENADNLSKDSVSTIFANLQPVNLFNPQKGWG